MLRRLFGLACIYVAVLGVTGVAQSRYLIAGQVLALGGTPLPNVTVGLRQEAETIQSVVTDAAGRFSFNVSIRAGARYGLQVTESGVKSPWFQLDPQRRDMQFSSGRVRLSVRMAPTGTPPSPPSRGGGDESNHAIVKVFYATDRARLSAQAVAYGGDRNGDGRLQLGRFDVSVPRDHQLAKIERPNIWTFWHENPNKHFIIVRGVQQTYEEYYHQISNVVATSARKEVFVFVHGFNVPFESAIYRTAQIAYDLGFDGAPILYSWPSEGSFVRYPVDLNNSQWTVPHLRWFLEDVASKSGARMIHVIAHSMGNGPLLAALNQIAIDARTSPRPRFSQVILTAPDVDADGFRQIAQTIKRGADRVTLYASSNDQALKLSKQYQGYQRAGDTSPTVVIVAGIDTIDVSGVDSNLIGHFYYGDNKSVLTDIFYLIRDAKPPARRFGLRSLGAPPQQYWVFRP
jgi:esterase/lipase superfamily enzyme